VILGDAVGTLTLSKHFFVFEPRLSEPAVQVRPRPHPIPLPLGACLPACRRWPEHVLQIDATDAVAMHEDVQVFGAMRCHFSTARTAIEARPRDRDGWDTAPRGIPRLALLAPCGRVRVRGACAGVQWAAWNDESTASTSTHAEPSQPAGGANPAPPTLPCAPARVGGTSACGLRDTARAAVRGCATSSELLPGGRAGGRAACDRHVARAKPVDRERGARS
jgi:hypothetical protein